MKGSASGAQLFWGNNNAYSGTRSIALGDNDGEFHTYIIDFTSETTWTGSDMNVRLDAVSSGGPTFEIDYIRASTNALVPEPGSLALLGLGGLMLVKRRQRD